MRTHEPRDTQALFFAEQTYGACAPIEDIDRNIGVLDAINGVPLGGVILDIGSGAGLDLHARVELVRPDVSILGVDVGYRNQYVGDHIQEVTDDVLSILSTEEQLALRGCGGRWQPHLAAAASWRLPIRDEQIDLVVSHASIPLYLPLSLIDMTLGEVVRVLKPGGQAVLGPYPSENHSTWDQAVDELQEVGKIAAHRRNVVSHQYNRGIHIGTSDDSVTILEKC